MTVRSSSRRHCSFVDSPARQLQQPKTARLLNVVMVLSLVALTSGCQATKDRGLVRAWADVNSVGSPAAFVDQFRTDGFRTAPPATGLANVETIEIYADSYNSGKGEYEQFPVFEPAAGSSVEHTSHESARLKHIVNTRPVSRHPVPVVPAGAWLF